jgi:hypothetical protein
LDPYPQKRGVFAGTLQVFGPVPAVDAGEGPGILFAERAGWFYAPLMQIKDRIYLTWQYGKGQLLLGGVYNVVCACLMAQDVYYAFFVDAFILKTVFTAITLYLIKQFRDRDAIFFYINLGLSRRKLLVSTVLADFLALAILLTIVIIVHG